MNKRAAFTMSGLCGDCGGPRDTELTVCGKCREKRRERKAARYVYHKERGICTKCESQHAEHGKTVCEQCRSEENARAAKRRAECLTKGICNWCKERKRDPGKYFCAECAVKRAEHRRKQAKAEGRSMKPYRPIAAVPKKPAKERPQKPERPKAIDVAEDALFTTDPGWGRQIMARVRARLTGQQYADSVVGQWWMAGVVGRCA